MLIVEIESQAYPTCNRFIDLSNKSFAIITREKEIQISYIRYIVFKPEKSHFVYELSVLHELI